VASTPAGVKRRLVLTILVGLSALALAACGSSSSSSTSTGTSSNASASGGTSTASSSGAKPASLKVGFIPIAGAAPIVIAEKNGDFAKQSLNVSNDNLTTPSEGVANLLSGRDQIGFINPGGVAQAAQAHLPIQVIAPLYYSTTDQGIYAKAGGPIKTIADLKGKTIALGALKNNTQAAVLYQLQAAGVDPSSVKFTLIPVAEIPAAIEAGKVDAGQVAEPFITQAGSKLQPIIKNMYVGLGSPAPQAYAITSKQWAQANAGLLTRFKTAFAAAENNAATDPAAVRSAIGTYTEIPQALLAKMTLPGFGTNLAINSLNQQLQQMVKYGFIPKLPNTQALFGQ
jgi:NitT/TauT family transport system substrate-binding protein